MASTFRVRGPRMRDRRAAVFRRRCHGTSPGLGGAIGRGRRLVSPRTHEGDMSLPRSVEPELLDRMPADDRRAVRARRDLKRLNAVILQTGIMAPILARQWRRGEPRTILDLGTGDGTFMLGVARRLAPRWRDVNVTLLDRQNIVSPQTRTLSPRSAGTRRASPRTCSIIWRRSNRPGSTSSPPICSCTISSAINWRVCCGWRRNRRSCSWPASRAATSSLCARAGCCGRSAATRSACTMRS